MNLKIRLTPCGFKEIFYFYDFLLYLDYLIRNKKENDQHIMTYSEKFLVLKLLHLDSSLNNKDNIAIHISLIKPKLVEACILNKITKKHWIIQVNESDDIKIMSISKKDNKDMVVT